MTPTASCRRLPEVALQFGTAAFAVLRVPDISAGTVVVLASPGRPTSRATHLATLLNDRRLSTLTLSLPVQVSRPLAATAGSGLPGRVATLLQWLGEQPELGTAPVGCLGIGPAAAIALRLTETDPRRVDALVAVAGWTDLVEIEMSLVEAPTLLIEGADDQLGVERACRALSSLSGDADLERVIGTIDPMATVATRSQVADFAAAWFHRHFAQATDSPTWRLNHAAPRAGNFSPSLFF
jgi:putative phosphoribosyl transferase